MSQKYETYRQDVDQTPDNVLAWNMYGVGVESIGRDGAPERFPLPEPSDDQMLVRVDSVGMCFSDVKLIRQGGSHPKLYNRDLAVEPTRLGHEAAITVVRVGRNLADQYQPGQRLAVQPDIYQDGRSTAYGYTIPGGLIQYHLIGPELLETDAGACLLPLQGDLGYAETALLEPWGCVMAAYTQRRRLTPRPGGTLWIIGRPGDEANYTFSRYLDQAARIVLSDVSPAVAALARAHDATVVERNDLTSASIDAISQEFTAGRGFDDIVMLSPQSAPRVSEIARHIARRGTLNLVGTAPLDGLVDADVGRLHYDYVAFVGTSGPDIAAAYGEDRNRCELRQGGVAVFVGAGGPMGQMHVQRALELPDGPELVIATEVNDDRLAALANSFGPLAKENGRRLLTFNPMNNDQSLAEFVAAATDGRGADDVVVSVPHAGLMAEADTVMADDGMLVLFAGVPNGTMAPLNLSNVYRHNAQYTGTSGLTLADQALVMERALAGSLSPERAVAAIGGIEAAQDGVVAMMESRYPGKIVIFPQISGLPLTSLADLHDAFPAIAAHLGPNDTWTRAAEQALIEQFWQPPAP